ncbi:LamG domain-containing protein [Patescibacteria group bacterium]
MKVPLLPSTYNLTLYMYYGNPSIENQQSATQVWDDDYKLVQHMASTSVDTRYDSTKYNNDGTISGYEGDEASSTSKINGADNFDGTDDIVEIQRQNYFSQVPLTVSAWVKFNQTPETTGDCHYFFLHRSTSTPSPWVLEGHNATNKLLFTVRDTSQGWNQASSDNPISTSTWYYVVGTLDSNYDYKLFVDGDLQTDTGNSGDMYPADSIIRIGGGDPSGSSKMMYGIVDEARFSNTIRSDAWIETEYNNQYDPSSFISPQDEEVGPGPVGYWAFDKGSGQVAYDETGNNNGTITGATWQDESMCVSGKCLWFDGVDDQVSIASITPPRAGTIVFWLRLADTSGTQRPVGGHDNFEIRVRDGGQLTNEFFSYGTSHVSNKRLLANEWYHLTFTWDIDGTGWTYIYINGALDSSKHEANTEASSTIDFTIGSRNGLNPVEGFIDEVKIYPYARDADQIKQDYNAGLAGIGTAHGVSASFGSESDSWMTDGLVGYWKMDESATTSGAIDSSGNGNTGTYYGEASTTAGKFGNGGVVDGTDDEIDIPYSSSLGITTDFSIFAWIKKDIADMSSGANIIAKDNGTPGAKDATTWDYTFGFPDSTDKLNFYSSGWAYMHSDTAILDTEWHYIGVARKGDTITYYLDGNPDGVYTKGNTLPDNGFDVHIGAEHWGGANYFDGQIDEVRVYKRALSPKEVDKLYNWAPGPVAHWKFDENKGTTAYDSAASTTDTGNNPGTLSCYGAGCDNPTWTRGKYGSALLFDGSEDYVRMNNMHIYKDNQDFTFMSWLYREDTGGRYFYWLDTDDCGFGVLYAGGTVGIDLHFDGDSDYRSADNVLVNTNQWYHVAYVVNSNGEDNNASVDYYVDGIYKESDTFIAAVSNTRACAATRDAYLGSDDGTGNFVGGKIDDVRIYNYARTDKQIVQDMSARGGSVSGGNAPLGSQSAVLHLKFDEGYGETAYDTSFYKNNGTINCGSSGSNDATSSMWELDGRLGRGIEFDGTDDYVEIASDSSLDDLDALTWTAWIYPTGWGNGNAGVIISKHDSWKHWRLANGVGYPEQSIRGYFHCDAGTCPGSTAATNTIALDTWQHVVLTYDDTGERIIHLYVDTEEVEYELQEAATGVLRDESTFDFRIGAYDLVTRWFDGIIDEVKIYPYVLTQTELEMDYNTSKSAIMGAVSTATSSSGTYTPSWSKSKQYCVPGDDSHCAPPVLELKFDEKQGNTAYDTSGQGNDGQLGLLASQSSSSPSWARGKPGNALEFDGSNDHIRISDHTSLDVTTSFTMSAWVYPHTLGGNDNGRIIDKTYSGNGYMLLMEDTNRFGVQYSGGAAGIYSNNNVITLNEWNHLTAVIDSGGDGVSFYRNSITVGGGTMGGVVDQNDGELWIGLRHDWGRAFDGLIDQVRIYNYERTPAQIAWDYNRGQPVAYWRFDECQGGTIFDQSGNNNHGTLQLGTTGDQTATGTCASSSDSSFWWNGRDGKINSAGSFDGDSDYIDTVDMASLDNASYFTISAWIRPDTLGDWEVIFSKRTNSENQILIQESGAGSGGNDDFLILVKNGSNDGGIRTTGNIISTGVWQHIVVVYDGTIGTASDRVTFYHNGIQPSIIKTSDFPATTADTPNVIIGSKDGTAEFFDGLIDEVKIFNYALTPQQVKTEYNSGAVRFSD